MDRSVALWYDIQQKSADAALLNRYGYALCSGKIGREMGR